jgi:hypothetical protein
VYPLWDIAGCALDKGPCTSFTAAKLRLAIERGLDAMVIGLNIILCGISVELYEGLFALSFKPVVVCTLFYARRKMAGRVFVSNRRRHYRLSPLRLSFLVVSLRRSLLSSLFWCVSKEFREHPGFLPHVWNDPGSLLRSHVYVCRTDATKS